MRVLTRFLLACPLVLALPVMAQPQRGVIEPRKIKAAKALKADEGALLLSVRSQRQGTETLFVYFVAVDEAGRDGAQVYRFERGAGVPIAGSNMIDQKPIVYRLPAGRYRPLAFTIGCEGVPFEGAICSRGLGGNGLPTGYYRSSRPVITVKPGTLTNAGDFIVEYTGTLVAGETGQGAFGKESRPYALRWRPLQGAPNEAFNSLAYTAVAEADVSVEFRSRIHCEKRPSGVMLYIPFDCPSGASVP